jgi:hypothetical protein
VGKQPPPSKRLESKHASSQSIKIKLQSTGKPEVNLEGIPELDAEAEKQLKKQQASDDEAKLSLKIQIKNEETKSPSPNKEKNPQPP